MTTEAAATRTSSRRRTALVVLGVLVLLVALAAAAFVLASRPSEEPAVAYILDTSPRMNSDAEGQTRLQAASSVMAEIVRPADPALTAGLRVFGSGAVPQGCDDTELLVPFRIDNNPTIADGLNGVAIGPASESALARSMVAAILDLTEVVGPQSIVVVTGGEDSCSAEAGRFVAAEAERAGIEVKTYIIGFMVDERQAAALKTMADQLGGSFYNAPSPAALKTSMLDVQSRVERGGAPSLAEAMPTAVDGESAGPSGTGDPSGPGGAPEATAGPGEGAPPAPTPEPTACEHPFLPLKAGAHWEYSYDGSPATWDVTSVSGDMTSAAATVVISVPQGSVAYTWDCSADGILYFQLTDFDFSVLGPTDDLEVVVTPISGLPLPHDFGPGVAWSSVYNVTITIESGGSSTVILNEVTESYSAGAETTLNTGAGPLLAIPVSLSGSTSTTDAGGTSTSSSNGTCWFSSGIGWLGCDMISGGEASLSELLGYSIP